MPLLPLWFPKFRTHFPCPTIDPSPDATLPTKSSKILTNRLKAVIHLMASSSQAAFISRWSISDRLLCIIINVILLLELLWQIISWKTLNNSCRPVNRRGIQIQTKRITCIWNYCLNPPTKTSRSAPTPAYVYVVPRTILLARHTEYPLFIPFYVTKK